MDKFKAQVQAQAQAQAPIQSFLAGVVCYMLDLPSLPRSQSK